MLSCYPSHLDQRETQDNQCIILLEGKAMNGRHKNAWWLTPKQTQHPFKICAFLKKIEPNLERIRNKQKRHGATTAYLLIVCLSSNLGGSRSRATNACRSSSTALASSSSAPPPSIPARPPLSNSFSCAQICQQIRK